MPSRTEEESLKSAVKQAHKRVMQSKSRADRLTEGLVEGNQRQSEFLASMRRANVALGGK